MDDVRAWTENEENENNEAGGSYIGARLAACLWIISKAVKNNLSPVHGDDRRKRLSGHEQNLQPC